VDLSTSASGKKQRNPHLVSYVDALLDCKKEGKFYLHQQLIAHMLKMIRNPVSVIVLLQYSGLSDLVTPPPSPQHPKLPNLATFTWFLFDATIKSMTVYLSDNKMLDNRDPRSERFPEEFYKDTKDLIQGLMTWIRDFSRGVQDGAVKVGSPPSSLNTDIALFLKDLLSLADRTRVFEMVLTLLPYIEDPIY